MKVYIVHKDSYDAGGVVAVFASVEDAKKCADEERRAIKPNPMDGLHDEWVQVQEWQVR